MRSLARLLRFRRRDREGKRTLRPRLEVLEGRSLLSGFSTYLGGISDDYENGVAVDALGNTFLAGTTRGDFPVTAGAFAGGSFDAFVAKLGPDGTTHGCHCWLAQQWGRQSTPLGALRGVLRPPRQNERLSLPQRRGGRCFRGSTL